MTLEIWDTPEQLYLARGDDVNPLRPMFTGDVYDDVEVPGVQAGGMAIVIAHPCSMRGREARLEPRVLTAAVAASSAVGKSAWRAGHYGLMPLPDLLKTGELHVARLDDIGKASTSQLLGRTRLACLLPYGVNMLQQRFIFRLTRHEVPTHVLQEVSAHVFEEADLLEEWSEIVCAAGSSPEDSATSFEAFLRADSGDGRSLQGDLRYAQRWSSVRRACRAEARRIAKGLEGGGAQSS